MPAAMRLGLGTAPLGGLFSAVSDEAAAKTLEAAWAAGIRMFDTAPLYGHGLAERRLGAFLKSKPRESFSLATKAGRLLRLPDGPEIEDFHYKNTPPERPVFDFSYDGIMRSFEESLERLGLGRIDILHLHDPDDHFDEAISGGWRALEKLRGEGLAKRIGAGMNQSAMLTRLARERRFDCFLLAGRYTLLEQHALDELLPLCIGKGISVFIGGVYNSGLLADPKPGATFNYEAAPAALIQRAQAIAAVCARHHVPLKAAAIQFPLAHPAVEAVLTGARSAAELIENVAMFQFQIPPALWQELKHAGFIRADAPVPGP